MNNKSNFKGVVLQIDPRGVIIAGGNEVVRRQQHYASKLSNLRVKNFLDLVVISASKSYKKISDSKSNFYFYTVPSSNFNILSYISKVIRLCKSENMSLRLIVAGDPWESLICAKIIRFFLNKHIPIQVHIHADICNPVWMNLTWRNWIRSFVAQLALKNVESIRTVGDTQTKYIMKRCKLKESRVRVIPVPINSHLFILSSVKTRPASVAFIGRLQKDRGIDRFVKLVKILNLNNKLVEFIIAGSGPDKEIFLRKIESLLTKSGYRYLGQLSELELKKVWRNVGVLVSTAPAESYGMAMREALVAGIPVWATKSSGVEDLISKAGKDAVKILDLSKSSRELNRELNQLLKSKVSLSFRRQFIKDNSTYAQLLAKSWVDLIDKQKK